VCEQPIQLNFVNYNFDRYWLYNAPTQKDYAMQLRLNASSTMDNLSKKQQILLAAGLPTLGLMAVVAGLISGTGAIAIIIGGALIPCVAGIWMAFHPQSDKASIDPEMLGDIQGKVEAIAKSQAVIDFNLDGTIITAQVATRSKGIMTASLPPSSSDDEWQEF
jgi:hypothetical protein